MKRHSATYEVNGTEVKINFDQNSPSISVTNFSGLNPNAIMKAIDHAEAEGIISSEEAGVLRIPHRLLQKKFKP